MIYIWILAVFLILYICYRILSNHWLVPNLSQKSVLITGCDTGFGHTLALKLVRKGMTVFATCLTREGEENLKSSSAGGLGKLITIPMNVTSQESVDSALAHVKQHLGSKGLWALVNNAGILGANGPCDWLTIDEWKRPFDVNCFGMIRVTQSFKPLVKKERGRIIIITSLVARQIVPLCAPYCASKHAAEAYASSLRMEMQPFKVGVHIVEPGFMATNLTCPLLIRSSLTEMWHRQPKHIQNEYGEAFMHGAPNFLDRAFKLLRSNRVHAVPNACMHAVISRLPKLRYTVGFDANIFLSLKWIPTAMEDGIIYALLYLTGYPKLDLHKARTDESG